MHSTSINLSMNDKVNLNNLEDYNIQNKLLPGVSRTFALTIPELPPELAPVVTNAYLLCRIADTIEDDYELPAQVKSQFEQEFIQVVCHGADANLLSRHLSEALSLQTPVAERELIEQMPKVIRCLLSFNARQKQSLQRCVRIMSQGMSKFQRKANIGGLNNLSELNHYCYYVAGVVGEMLTELFCDYSSDLDRHYSQLLSLSRSFGLGLQMTNILKDIWDDRERGACWYPRDIFQNHGIELTELDKQHRLHGFELGLNELIAIALGHLDNALKYAALIPVREGGIRRFCLWAIGLAIMTLKKIYRHPQFEHGAQVKISRRTVKATLTTMSVCAKNNYMLKYWFKLMTLGMPKTAQSTVGLFTEWFDHE